MGLPSGWSSGGSTGTIRTTTEYLNIIPNNGCSGGSVTVKAYVSSCSGYKYSNTREAGTVYASVSCVTIPPKTVWVGKPKFTTEIQGRTQSTPGMQEQYYGK